MGCPANCVDLKICHVAKATLLEHGESEKVPMAFSDRLKEGGMAERLKAAVLKTADP